MAGVVVTRWVGEDGLADLVAAYHLATEREKGRPVDDVAGLPERYRHEVVDPAAAFAGDVVLVARTGDVAVGCAVGCVVLTPPVDGRAELKRLWVDPARRGGGVAGELVGAALDQAGRAGVRVVRLSVWRWRTGAVGLYERLGFAVVEPWDEREGLVCMERIA